MHYDPKKPLVVQSDRTLFIEVQHEQFAEVREQLHDFAELIKSPAYIHTYRLTPLSLWNAAASGWTSSEIISFLNHYAKYPLSLDLERSILEDISKYGRFSLRTMNGQLCLLADEKEHLLQLSSFTDISAFLSGDLFSVQLNEDPGSSHPAWAIRIASGRRGDLKQQSIRLGYPIQDAAGYVSGETLSLSFVEKLPSGEPFALRDYQEQALSSFAAPGKMGEGHGVLVLPCGSGKTIIGMAAVVQLQCETLILTTNTTSVKQWKQELLEKTTLTDREIGEYTGEKKQIRPVTIATYQVLTYRENKAEGFIHMKVFQERKWGLIIYDEVHLLPAPVFRATASIQSTRRLGLTATLVREDGREEDVFSLIGPKRADIAWKELEQQGFIAKAYCTEVRVDFNDTDKEQYYLLSERQKTRWAQENPNKIEVVKQLLHKHEGEPTLIIGQYVHQLEELAEMLRIPVITGKIKQQERDRLYAHFREGKLPVLAVSKVANFAIDLPDATVAIQISGAFGSRQEEAQRLGRILRPKSNGNEAYFYHIVTKDSKDEQYALKRQLFLVEQGYHYQLLNHQE